LVLALALIAVVTFGAERLAARVDHWRRQTALASEYLDGIASVHAARARAFVWLSSRPANSMGFGGLVVDDRPFSLSDGTLVSIQDERGLLPLNTFDDNGLTTLLRHSGLDPGITDRLTDTLADYIDGDNLHRLNGAEADAYAKAGLPVPRNDYLYAPHELRNLLVWREHPAAISAALRFASARRDIAFNPWSAPMEVLRARWASVPEGGIAHFLLLRSQFSAFPDVNAMGAALSGIPGIPSDYNLAPRPGEQFRVSITPRSGPVLIYNLLLSPLDPDRPWTVLSAIYSERPDAPEKSLTTVAVPSAFPDFDLRTSTSAP
jgi:hypothetical protein